MTSVSDLRTYLTDRKVPAWTVHLISLVFSIGLFAYILLSQRVLQPDLGHHFTILHDMLDGKIKVGHPVFFLLVSIFSGGTRVLSHEIFAAFIVFSGSQYLKIVLSQKLINQIFKTQTSYLSLGLILLCQIAINIHIPADRFIVGAISPNYFHNGTLLLSMPFALLMLIGTFQYLENGERKQMILVLIYGIILAAIKPSFLFLWIPIVPFYVLYTNGPGKILLGILQISILLVFIIIFQSIILKNPSLDFKVVFNPFFYFGSVFNHFKVVVSSLLFPICCALAFGRTKNKPWILFWGFALQGLLISFLFYDTIHGLISANMTWQSSIAHYLLFLFSAGICISYQGYYRKPAFWFCLAVLFVHCLTGIQYLRLSTIVRSFFI